MRQIIATAVTAVIVSLLTLTVAGAVAQPPAVDERDILPSAKVGNADRVDGRHAIAYTSLRGKRRGKLVATNARGMLPPNIVTPLWGLIKNKPAGFADGVDDVGVTAVRVTYVPQLSGTNINGSGAVGTSTATCPAGSVVIGGGYRTSGGTQLNVYAEEAVDARTWSVSGHQGISTNAVLYAHAICLTVEPAGAITTAARRN